MKKSEVRENFKLLIKELTIQQMEEKSLSLGKNLSSLLLQENFVQKNVGGFYPLNDEPNYLLVKELDEIVNCYPLTEEKESMTFRVSSSEELCEVIYFGRTFKVPSSDKEIIEPGVLIIPGLGFDYAGNRLGRGKGFYDRYLEKYIGIKIGICFHEQLEESVPHDDLDVPVDFIVTDQMIVKVK